jgi:tetratricopeptide (TPR) repeat protein
MCGVRNKPLRRSASVLVKRRRRDRERQSLPKKNEQRIFNNRRSEILLRQRMRRPRLKKSMFRERPHRAEVFQAAFKWRLFPEQPAADIQERSEQVNRYSHRKQRVLIRKHYLLRSTLFVVSSLGLAFLGAGCAKAPSPEDSVGSQAAFQHSMLEEETERAQGSAVEIPKSSDAAYNFMRGQLALSKEDYNDALDYFKKAASLEKSPAPTLRKSLAQLYVRMGRMDDALEEVDKALKEDPDDTDLLQLRGGILAAKHETDAAIETYKKIIALSPPDHEDSYVLIASLYAQSGNLAGAKDILKQLVSKNPNSFFGYYYLGRMSEAGGDAAGAEQNYKKALSVNPDAEGVNLDLARVYGAQKRFPEAIELCRRVVDENPKNAAARNLLAQLLMGDNKVDKALQEFETLGQLEEDPTDTRLKIALIKLQRRDLEGAITELNLILAQHPENSAAHYYLSSAYAGMKRVNDALSEIRKIHGTDEYFVESRVLGAFMLQQEKRAAEGVKFLQDALSVKKDSPKLLTLLATMQHEAQQTADAVETIRHLIEVDPGKDKNYFTLGVFLDELGKKQDAIAAMRKAIELEPKNANALNYLGYTLVEQGQDLDEAESLIKRALDLEKDNGYFLDSLGWLYFTQQKYKDAARELERAAKLVPTDAVILEHYALALQKTDNIAKAKETAEKALLHAPESDDKQVAGRLKKLLSELKEK